MQQLLHACQFMRGLQVSEAFVLSLPVYMLMYEKVQSDAEQQAMTHQQPGAARDFTSGAYTALPTTHAPHLCPAAAAAAANIKHQCNTQPAATTRPWRSAMPSWEGQANKSTGSTAKNRLPRRKPGGRLPRGCNLICHLLHTLPQHLWKLYQPARAFP